MAQCVDDADERRLVKKAQEGDAGAFGRLYEAYLDRIYRYIYFRVGSVPKAEELSDDVFVRAWEALPTYEYTSGNSLAPWLYRIAHNLVMDHYRRQHLQEKNEPLFAVADHPPSVEEMVARKEDVVRIVHAVRALGDVEQSVLLLRFVEQLPYREIAQIVDKSEGACRVIQYRALAALRDLLEAERGTQEKADG